MFIGWRNLNLSRLDTMTNLLDGNVLVALVFKTHLYHARCSKWFAGQVQSFATCSMTQAILLKMHMKMAAHNSAQAAWHILKQIVNHPKHQFWEDNFSYQDVPFQLLYDYKHVTNAWLAELARRRAGKVVTLDASFAALFPDKVVVVPVI